MRRILLFFWLLTIITFEPFFAQGYENIIRGNIKDSNTKEPLRNVNIYLSNTTWGTSSDSNGAFRISSILPGKYEIVFSIIGYETESRSIVLNDTSKIFIDQKLLPKIYLLDEVTIVKEKPQQWLDDLEEFKKKFFGYSEHSYNCNIVNENYIEFYRPNENVLIAKCDYPLEIINYTLGYNIKCEIQEFKYDEHAGKLKQNYRLFYSEIDTTDSKVKEEWLKNRKRNNKESLFFFLKTLISDKQNMNDFEISIVNSARSFFSAPNNEIFSINQILEKNDSSDTYKLFFDDYLMVKQYEYNRMKMLSWIKLNYPSITIDKYGYPIEDYAITILGDWAELGVASFLPKNFGNE